MREVRGVVISHLQWEHPVALALRLSAPPEHEAQKQSSLQPQFPAAQAHLPSAQQAGMVGLVEGLLRRGGVEV
jgi:hypothetical protein